MVSDWVQVQLPNCNIIIFFSVLKRKGAKFLTTSICRLVDSIGNEVLQAECVTVNKATPNTSVTHT